MSDLSAREVALGRKSRGRWGDYPGRYLEAMTPRTLSQLIKDQREAADRMLPTLAKDPIEAIEKLEPRHPMEANDPTDPMDRVDPVEPMDSRESREAIDQREFDITPSSPLPSAERYLTDVFSAQTMSVR